MEFAMAAKRGFTLIELMIVVAIMAILAMIAAARYLTYLERARESAARTLLQNLALAEFTLKTNPMAEADFLPVTGFDAATKANLKTLGESGFRPDEQIAFTAVPFDGEVPGGFLLFAAHISLGARVFVYNFVPLNGVRLMDPSGAYAVALPGTIHAYRWDGSDINLAATLEIDPGAGLVTEVTK
jgi:prepilin-type N-terminal cleavage/methylation domain-containing protein